MMSLPEWHYVKGGHENENMKVRDKFWELIVLELTDISCEGVEVLQKDMTMFIAFLIICTFLHRCLVLHCVQFTHLYAGFKKSIFNRERIFAHRKSCESLQRLWKRNCNKLKALRHRRQSANLKRSCNRNVNEQVLYWQGPPHLLNLIAVLVLLHEEHVGDILRLAGLKDIGKLWGILG